MYLKELSSSIQKGDFKKAKELVILALSKNVNAEMILNKGILPAMDVTGTRFKNNEIYVPEVLIAARAMNAAMQILEPELIEAGIESIGKAVIGTVKGDLHDIGKNLVGMMLKGVGIKVYDIGVDVSANEFVNKSEEVGAKIVCLSALLTTTMPAMKDVIDEFSKREIRDDYIFMIGGAPITANYAKEIGADYYAADAATAAEIAKSLL